MSGLLLRFPLTSCNAAACLHHALARPRVECPLHAIEPATARYPERSSPLPQAAYLAQCSICIKPCDSALYVSRARLSSGLAAPLTSPALLWVPVCLHLEHLLRTLQVMG